MAEIRREHGLQFGAELVRLGVEGGVIERVIGLAAEIEIIHEQIADILFAGNAEMFPVIDKIRCHTRLGPPVSGEFLLVGDEPFAGLVFAAIQIENFRRQRHIPIRRVVIFEELIDVAFLPELEQIVIERRRPPDTAFEKADIEFWKPARDPGQEQGAGRSMTRRREQAETVEHVVGGRAVGATIVDAVTRGRHLELDAFSPERVVIIRAVEGERCPVHGIIGELRRPCDDFGVRAQHFIAGHRRPHAEFLDREFQLANSLVRRMHRYQGGRAHPVGNFLEDLRVHHVECAAGGGAHLVIGHHLDAKAIGTIKSAKIDTGFIKPFLVKPRQHGCQPVNGVRPGMGGPEQRFCFYGPGFLQRRIKPFDEIRPADLLEKVGENETTFDYMGIAIDDRMI